MKKHNNYLFRVILIGDCGVGKTSILERYNRNYFCPETPTTIGIDFATKNITLGGNQVRLQIWDTSGQEKFHSITTSYYRSGDICLMVYDVGLSSSFISLDKWYQEYRDSNSNGILVIVGNKIDNPKVVDTNLLKQYADRCKAIYTEVSSKTGEGVEQLFDLVIREAIGRKDNNRSNIPSSDQIVHLQDTPDRFPPCSGCTSGCFGKKQTIQSRERR